MNYVYPADRALRQFGRVSHALAGDPTAQAVNRALDRIPGIGLVDSVMGPIGRFARNYAGYSKRSRRYRPGSYSRSVSFKNPMPYRRKSYGRTGRRPYRRSRRYKKRSRSVGTMSRGSSRVVRRRSRPKRRFTKRVIKRQLRQLTCAVDASTGHMTHISRSTARIVPAANQCAYVGKFWNVASLETVLSNLLYYNPAVPGTLTTAAGATGTYSRQFCIDKIISKCTVRNNYQIPCRIRIYFCRPKTDTDLTVYNSVEQGLTDNPAGALDISNILTFPSDSDLFNKTWSIQGSWSKTLEAGQEITALGVIPMFKYNPSVYDSDDEAYQRKYGSHEWFVRVEGILAHDSVQTSPAEVGISRAGADMCVTTTTLVTYDAGTNISFKHTSDNADSFTNDALVSQKPIADNQAFASS